MSGAGEEGSLVGAGERAELMKAKDKVHHGVKPLQHSTLHWIQSALRESHVLSENAWPGHRDVSLGRISLALAECVSGCSTAKR